MWLYCGNVGVSSAVWWKLISGYFSKGIFVCTLACNWSHWTYSHNLHWQCSITAQCYTITVYAVAYHSDFL